MSYKIYIPIDSTAKSLGANEVAHLIELEAQSRKIDLQIIRNGSRGLFWLEPMLEVETDQGRVAYGPVTQNDIESLFDAEFFMGKAHPLFLGVTDEIDWLKKTRKTYFCSCRCH
jgi:formate dehydrogenase iron-sulfur subunit